jgi:hypothetical protein
VLALIAQKSQDHDEDNTNSNTNSGDSDDHYVDIDIGAQLALTTQLSLQRFETMLTQTSLAHCLHNYIKQIYSQGSKMAKIWVEMSMN